MQSELYKINTLTCVLIRINSISESTSIEELTVKFKSSPDVQILSYNYQVFL